MVEGSLGHWDGLLELESACVEAGAVEGRVSGLVKANDEAVEQGVKKGFELGLELGFYKGVVKVLWKLTRDGGLKALLSKNAKYNGSTRAKGIENLLGKLEKDRIKEVLDSLASLLDAFQVGRPFSNDVHEELLRIRAKFKVLESRLGLTLEITPELDHEHENGVAKTLEF